MPEFSTEDVATGILKINNEEIILCSGYFDININEIPDIIMKLCNFCNTNNKKLILGCDTNSHCPLWGGEDLNTHGEMVESFIFEKNLDIVNIGQDATFSGINNEFNTFIDITLTSCSMMDRIINWKVDIITPSHSDHRYISYELNDILISDSNEGIYDLQKCNWKLFRDEISNAINDSINFHSYEELNEMTENLENIIKQ